MLGRQHDCIRSITAQSLDAESLGARLCVGLRCESAGQLKFRIAGEEAIQFLTGVASDSDNCYAMCIFMHKTEYLTTADTRIRTKKVKMVPGHHFHLFSCSSALNGYGLSRSPRRNRT